MLYNMILNIFLECLSEIFQFNQFLISLIHRLSSSLFLDALIH